MAIEALCAAFRGGGASRLFSLALLAASEFLVTAQYRDGFRVERGADGPALPATIQLCEIKRLPAIYDEISHWDFASAANGGGLTVNITKSFPIGWPGLVGEEIGIAAGTVGAIQVGINGRRGSIRIPDVPEEADGIIVRACVRHPQNGRYMVVEYGEPAASTKIELTEEMQEYYAKVTATGQIGISNSAQASPLQVADIRLVANYQYPCVQTNSLSYTSIGQRRHWVFRSLSTGEYVWRVGVRHTNDADMDFSAFYHVSLDEEDPLAPVGFVMSIQ